MGCLLSAMIGAVAGGMLITHMVIVGNIVTPVHAKQEMLDACELNLPRTQTCELVAVPKEVEGVRTIHKKQPERD